MELHKPQKSVLVALIDDLLLLLGQDKSIKAGEKDWSAIQAFNTETCSWVSVVMEGKASRKKRVELLLICRYSAKDVNHIAR